jgi:hypothetical protein
VRTYRESVTGRSVSLPGVLADVISSDVAGRCDKTSHSSGSPDICGSVLGDRLGYWSVVALIGRLLVLIDAFVECILLRKSRLREVGGDFPMEQPILNYTFL